MDKYEHSTRQYKTTDTSVNRLKHYYDQSKRPQTDPPALSNSVEIEIPLEFIPDESVPKVKIVENDDMDDPAIFQVKFFFKSRLRHGVTEHL